jgi:hypothetical protein
MEHDTGATTHTRVVLPEAARWELAMSLRRATDRSADLLRALLFLLAAGVAGYAATRHFTLETMLFHLGSIVSAALAMAFIIGTWLMTRAESTARYQALVTEGVDHESDPQTVTVRDQVACWFVFTAAAIEVVALLLHIEA